MAINKLKTTSIEVDAITADLLATGSITVADISDGEITAAKLHQSGATDGQAMVWSDTNSTWEPGNVASSGGQGNLPSGDLGNLTSDYSKLGIETGVSIAYDMQAETQFKTEDYGPGLV